MTTRTLMLLCSLLCLVFLPAVTNADAIDDKKSSLVPIYIDDILIFVPSLTNIATEPNALNNNSTLAGIDSNADGIRDDVERAIAIRFANKSDLMKFHLRIAKELQKQMTSNSIPLLDDMLNIDQAIVSYGLCVNKIDSDPDLGDYYVKELTFNTWERLERYLAAESVLTGSIARSPTELCPY